MNVRHRPDCVTWQKILIFSHYYHDYYFSCNFNFFTADCCWRCHHHFYCYFVIDSCVHVDFKSSQPPIESSRTRDCIRVQRHIVYDGMVLFLERNHHRNNSTTMPRPGKLLFADDMKVNGFFCCRYLLRFYWYFFQCARPFSPITLFMDLQWRSEACRKSYNVHRQILSKHDEKNSIKIKDF